jgi:hypothetical protein
MRGTPARELRHPERRPVCGPAPMPTLTGASPASPSCTSPTPMRMPLGSPGVRYSSRVGRPDEAVPQHPPGRAARRATKRMALTVRPALSQRDPETANPFPRVCSQRVRRLGSPLPAVWKRGPRVGGRWGAFASLGGECAVRVGPPALGDSESSPTRSVCGLAEHGPSSLTGSIGAPAFRPSRARPP